jgi:predicted amidohydrolase
MTTVICRQLAPVVGDLAGNRTRARRAIEEAVAAGAEIVVLPELVTSGYVFESVEEAEAVAVTPDHALFAEWAEAAGGALVIGGFAEAGDDGRVYNSAALVDATGVLGVYRKCHLWDREKLWFAPGADPPRVHDTRFGRVGVLICYDLEFPELTRTLALDGAELLAVPTNWPLVPRPAGERPPEVQIAMATARVNRMCIACCDRTGTEREVEWTAGTTIIDADGWPVATPGEDGAARAELDLATARDKRLTELADALGDRRPELYGGLARQSSASRR